MFTANELLAFLEHLAESKIAPNGGISPDAVTFTVSDVLKEMTDMGLKYQKYLSSKGA